MSVAEETAYAIGRDNIDFSCCDKQVKDWTYFLFYEETQTCGIVVGCKTCLHQHIHTFAKDFALLDNPILKSHDFSIASDNDWLWIIIQFAVEKNILTDETIKILTPTPAGESETGGE